MTLRILFLLSLLALAACGRPSRMPSLQGNALLSSEELSFDALNETIFKPRCASCHANFTVYESLMDSGTVLAKNPDQSSLYLRTASGQMPKGGPALSVAEVSAIYDWISAGAPKGSGVIIPPIGQTPGGSNPPGTTNPPPTGGAAEPTFAWLQANVFNPRCVMCHSGTAPSAGYDLSSFEGVTAGGRVVPGNSAGSRIYQRVISTTAPMPPMGGPLTAEQTQMLAQWIQSGALNASGQPPVTTNPPPTTTPPPSTTPSPTFAWINANVLIPKCIMCHQGASAPAGYNLTTYEGVMAGGRVVAGSPASSTFFNRINNNTMPPTGALDAATKNLISQWIQNGALNDAPAGGVVTPPPPTLPPLAATWTSINANIITPRCVGCHNATTRSGDINLASLTSVRNAVNNEDLMDVVNDNEMPRGGLALTSQQKSVLQQWIRAGMPNN